MGGALSPVEIGIAVAAAIVLFLFGVEHFSTEMQSVTGERFRKFIAKGTKNRFAGFALGAAVTAVIQSSTATSVIVVGLVNAGVLSFRQSLGVLFGANVGTTFTAQLVALKLTNFAPALILVGFVVGLLPFRWRVFGRSVFYFGLVFFSLDLVSAAVAPLRENPDVLAVLSSLDGAVVGVLVGAGFTALVQSSSVTTGVSIVLLAEGAITLEQALPLVIGANIGTTVTSLLAAMRLDTSAKRAAVSHALYNTIGAVAFLPFLGVLQSLLTSAGLKGAPALATAHLVFNVATSAFFLLGTGPFERMVRKLVQDEDDEVRTVVPLSHETFASGGAEARAAMCAWAADVVDTQMHCYTASVLAIETRDARIDHRARRIASIVDYALEEASSLVRDLADGELGAERSESILQLVVTIDHLRQIMDSLVDLSEISARLERQHGRFSIDSILEVQLVYPTMAKLFEHLTELLERPNHDARQEALRDQEALFDDALQDAYRNFLGLVRKLDERGELADVLSVHHRLRTKVHAFSRYIVSGNAVPLTGGEPEL